MKKIVGIIVVMTLLISALASTATADPLQLLCRVDIGNPTSEAGHDVISWGPIEPAAHPIDGAWGFFMRTGEDARVIWGYEEGTRCAFVTLDRYINPGAARAICLRHLDSIARYGIGDDCSFDVFIKDSYGNWVLTDHYTNQLNIGSTWLVTWVYLDEDYYGNPLDINENDDIEVMLCATGDMWLYFASDMGQVAFDWIELWGEEALPPVECGPCDGGVTSLTLQYNGTTPDDDTPVYVEVKKKKGDEILFDGWVAPTEMFTVTNEADKHGKLGSEIKIYVNGEEYTKIHTSCSQPIGIGMVFGDFEIVGGESLKGGTLPSIN